MDLKALQKLQRDTGFNPVFLEKAYHITRLLAAVQENEVLANALALKGGTALNFVYLDLPRLSIDLDFNFVGAIKKERMLEIRPHVREEITRLAGSLDYGFDLKPGSYIMERFLLRYRSLAGPADSVKLEINFLERVPVAGTVSKRFGHVFDLPAFKVKTYSLEEITAMKTKAMAERLYPRDIHDIFHASRMKMRKVLLRKLMMFYLVLAKREPRLDSLLRSIEKYDEKAFVWSLGPFLREAQATRVELGDIKKQVEEFYRKLFVLNRDDKAFLKSCESGHPDVGLLFRGMRVNQELRAHPGLLLALGKK
jgi:hypothetical protein